MYVRMYDCKFGDCFLLRNDGENDLYVDFGIHNSCRIATTSITNTYDNIIADMGDNTDFILTHYHADHFDGARMISRRVSRREVRKSYK